MNEYLLAYGGAAKALGDGKIRVPMVVFGGDGDLSTMKDRFTKNTDFEVPEWPGKGTLRFEHGQNEFVGKKALGDGVNGSTIVRDDTGIFVEAVLNLADNYEARIYKMVQDGDLGGSSGTVLHLIERKSLPEGGHEILRWPLGSDLSLTPRPADPRTRFQELKSLVELSDAMKSYTEIEEAIKAVGQVELLPLAAESRTWNSGEAIKRIKTWASNKDGIDFSKYSQAFFHKDGDGKKQSDYKFPFADIIDGKLTAIPRGIIAATKSISNAPAIREKIATYYAGMKMIPPWQTEKPLTMEEFAAKSEYFGECIEEAMTMGALSRLNDQLFYTIIWNAVFDDSLSAEEKTAKVAGAFDEFSRYAQIIFNALLGTDGEPDDDMKSLHTLWSDPKEFSTKPLREATKQVTGGLAETLERWDTEVFRFLSQGAKANAVLSKSNQESLLSGYGKVKEALSHMEDIMDRADMDYDDLGDIEDENAKAVKSALDKAILESENFQKTLL